MSLCRIKKTMLDVDVPQSILLMMMSGRKELLPRVFPDKRIDKLRLYLNCDLGRSFFKIKL